MGLQEYSDKRDFNLSPEPKGGNGKGPKGGKEPVFVVQKHDASRLHFDFRLEVDGVLKSWAVPKGPSMNPKDKRLAVMVEDHPLDYANFEGVIPEGEYGAGTVEIWDKGTFEIAKGHPSADESLKDGRLEFVLHGKKLKGIFALVRTKMDGKDDNWLLIKKNDEYAVHTPYDAMKIPSHGG